MIKKIFVGVLLAGVFGLLVFGAVNRTLAKTTENEYLTNSQKLAAGNGNGNGNNQDINELAGETQGNGIGDGSGPMQENRQTNLNLSEKIGEGGRSEGGAGNGQSGQSGAAGGNGQGGQSDVAPGDGTSTGIAEVEEWLTITGAVASTDPDLWVVTLSDGTSLDIEGRALSFLTELGFTVSVDDNLSLQVFLEDGEYEIGQIENQTTGAIAVIREESGRPLWAGGRQGGH